MPNARTIYISACERKGESTRRTGEILKGRRAGQCPLTPCRGIARYSSTGSDGGLLSQGRNGMTHCINCHLRCNSCHSVPLIHVHTLASGRPYQGVLLHRRPDSHLYAHSRNLYSTGTDNEIQSLNLNTTADVQGEYRPSCYADRWNHQ